MNKVELLAVAIESLAWPGLIGLVIFHFRKPLHSLLGKMTSVKFGGLEADFRERLSEIREDQNRQAQSAEDDLHDTDQSIEAPMDSVVTLTELADVSPRAAVLEAWVEVERASHEYVGAQGGSPHVPMYGLHRLPRHLRRPLEHILGQYDGLRRLRNEAAHAPDFAITPEAAREYVSASSYVAKVIRHEASIPSSSHAN